MTNGNHVTHNNKHTILINKTKFTWYCVPPAHATASVYVARCLAFPPGTKHKIVVLYRGGSSHFFGIGIYPVSDTAGIGIFGRYCCTVSFGGNTFFKILRELFF
jgi:hypothetical protein